MTRSVPGQRCPEWPIEARSASTKIAIAQPDLVAGCQIGGNGEEGFGQILDPHAPEFLAQHLLQAIAGKQAAAADPQIGQAQDRKPGQLPRPLFELVEPARGVERANNRTDRGAADNVGFAPLTASARMTPICAHPRADPLPRASPIRPVWPLAPPSGWARDLPLVLSDITTSLTMPLSQALTGMQH